MTKKQEINLNEIDTDFVISSFKNKERRNNPSSIPRALVPEHEKKAEENTEKTEATATPLSKETDASPREHKRKQSKSRDYKSLFLINADTSTRNGKLVSIREKYHDRITKIIQVIAKNEVSIFSYIDNVLQHHFEVFQDEISELYHKYYDEDDYLTPKK